MAPPPRALPRGHQEALANARGNSFPPVTLTDAARGALRGFYATREWTSLFEAGKAGHWLTRPEVTTGRSWTFALESDATLLWKIGVHAELLDGSGRDAVEDALKRFFRSP